MVAGAEEGGEDVAGGVGDGEDATIGLDEGGDAVAGEPVAEFLGRKVVDGRGKETGSGFVVAGEGADEVGRGKVVGEVAASAAGGEEFEGGLGEAFEEDDAVAKVGGGGGGKEAGGAGADY